MNNSLRARLRRRQDRDIKQGLERLGQLEQGELSDLIRDGMRLKLAEKGVLSNGTATESYRRDQGQLALFVDTQARE